MSNSATQAPLSKGFPRQKYWSRLLLPGSSQPRDQTHVSCFAGEFFTAEPPPGSPSKVSKEYLLDYENLFK